MEVPGVFHPAHVYAGPSCLLVECRSALSLPELEAAVTAAAAGRGEDERHAPSPGRVPYAFGAARWDRLDRELHARLSSG